MSHSTTAAVRQNEMNVNITLLTMMMFLVPFVLVNVFYGLELFVGLIQAFVFAMLTLVFAQTAVTSHDSHEGEHGEAHH